MIEVPAAMTISGILPWVANGAAASAAGVTPKPAMKLTLSLTISSWASRFVLSGTAASSFRMISILLPATVSPFCCMYSLTALSICLPVEAWPPVIGRIRPIFTLSCARAGATAATPANTTPAAARDNVLVRMNMNALPLIDFLPGTESPGPCRHHSPDFSAVYGRGMASHASDDVNLDDGRDCRDRFANLLFRY